MTERTALAAPATDDMTDMDADIDADTDGDRIDEGAFASEAQLQAWCDRIGEAGLRGTASASHERIIACLLYTSDAADE